MERDALMEAWAKADRFIEQLDYDGRLGEGYLEPRSEKQAALLRMTKATVRALAEAAVEDAYKHKHAHDERCEMDDGPWCPKHTALARIRALGGDS